MLASPHCEKTFPCVKLKLSIFYSTGFWSSRCICTYCIMFLPWKNSRHGCCSCSLHGPCCCVFTIPKFNFLGKLLPLLPGEIWKSQVLCMGHKQITSNSWLKFTGKFKQGFLQVGTDGKESSLVDFCSTKRENLDSKEEFKIYSLVRQMKENTNLKL